MNAGILNKTLLTIAGLAVPVFSLAGCGVEAGGSDPIGTKRQAFGVVQPREHHEFIDEDGLFVTYWERSDAMGNYVYGDVEMITFAGGYQSTVDFSGVSISNPNSVTGKGKQQCWGDVIDWTLAEDTGATAMGVYGWHEDPLVEYYIGRGGGRDAGTYTVTTGGATVTYRLEVQNPERENILNPEGVPGLPLKFLQYNVEVVSGPHPTEGPIDLAQHFAAWETLMATFWPAQTDWITAGWEWNEFTRANYCVVATEIWGPGPERTARIENITVTEVNDQIIDGSCNNVDNDNDGSIDEDWVSGFCMLPKNHPTCPQEHGSTICSTGPGAAESCVPDVEGTPDRCDGVDDDCDGTVDEDIEPETCDGVDNDCDGLIDDGVINLPIRCVHDDDGDGIENGLDTDPGTFSDEFAEPDFGATGGEILDRGDQTVIILDPFSDEGVWIETLPSGGPNEAEISLCGGKVTLTMGPGENQVVTCPETSCLFASEQLKLLDRAEVSSDFYAGNFVLQWDAKVFANGLSTGNGNLFDRAAITGTATVAGTVTGNRGGIATLVEGAAVDEQALVVFPISVPLGVPVNIPDYETGTLAPGVWGDVTVGREATLVLSAADTYTLDSLVLGPETVFDLTAAGTERVVIAVEGDVVLGDGLEVLGDAELEIYANGTSFVVGYDIASLTADIKAPNANVEVGDRTVFNGCLGGRNVTIGYDAKVNGETTTPPPEEPEPPLTFWQTTTGDWGGDYCIQVGAHNPRSTPVDWIITINTNGSTITNTWNADYSGTWGTVTADPNQSYNLVIDPGETDTSVGFCAHRWAPWQTATVVAVAAE